MTEWLKNVCMIPIRYGLDKFNAVAMNSIQIIFNLYGRRLLKMVDDKIIERSECINDRNIFYMYPLHLQQLEQDVGLNLVKVNKGIISGLTISMPWKALLSEQTEINIDSIDLVLDFKQNTNSIYLRSIEGDNSYFLSNKNIDDDNTDLLSVYKDIHDIISQYFGKIGIKLNRLNIEILDRFTICIENLCYSNSVLNIELIHICPIDSSHRTVELENITIEKDTHDIVIDKAFFGTETINCLPDFYTNKSESDFKCSLSINYLQIDDLVIHNIATSITPNIIEIMKTSSIEIPSIIKAQINDNIAQIMVLEKTINMNNQIDIILHNSTELTNWLTRMKNKIDILFNKLVVVDNIDEPKTDLIINNINVCLVNSNETIIINIESAIIGDDIVCRKISNRIFNCSLSLDNLVIDIDKNITINDLFINASLWEAQSVMSNVMIDNDYITISFEDATVTNIKSLIRFITQTYDLITTSILPKTQNDSEKSRLVRLITKRSNIHVIIPHQPCIIFGIKTMDVCISDKTARNIVTDITVLDSIVASISIDYACTTNIIVKQASIFIDPNIIDLINDTIVSLNQSDDIEQSVSIDPSDLRELEDALARSIIVDDIQDIETFEHLNTSVFTNSYPSHNILVKTVMNIMNTIIDDYKIQEQSPDMLIKIDTVYCYLFDKLKKGTTSLDKAIVCIVFKNASVNKTSTVIDVQDEPSLKVGVGMKLTSDDNKTDTIDLQVETFMIMDIESRDPSWKYMIKTLSTPSIIAKISMRSNRLSLRIRTTPIIALVREITVTRLLAFIPSNSTSSSKKESNILIESFDISPVHISLSFYPLVIEQSIASDTLALTNMKLILSSIKVDHIGGPDDLLDIIVSRWKDDSGITNIMNVIPNIKAIKPIASPLINITSIVSSYLSSPENKTRLKNITRTLTRSTDVVSSMIKNGITSASEYFK